MTRSRSQAPQFPFLELPAELRNQVYECLATGAASVRRINPRAKRNCPKVSRSEFLFSLGQICQEIRTEFMSWYFGCFHVGLHMLDLERFLRTFCRPVRDGTPEGSLLPQSITVYIPYVTKGNKTGSEMYFEVLNVLKLKLKNPALSCIFSLDPKVDWQGIDPITQWAIVPLYDRIKYDCQAFEILFACKSAKWTALIEADKLAAVFLLPFIIHNAPNIDPVFEEQPIGLPLHGKTLQFYLPDARGFGLEEVYQNPSVILGMSLMD